MDGCEYGRKQRLLNRQFPPLYDPVAVAVAADDDRSACGGSVEVRIKRLFSAIGLARTPADLVARRVGEKGPQFSEWPSPVDGRANY